MHKLINTGLSILLLGALTAVADETGTIDAQINAIHSATPQERVKLMNQFKERLSQMNAKERSQAIATMRTKMHKDKRHATHTNQDQTMKEHAQQEQMQHSEGMQQMQQMQERNHGERFMDEMDAHQGGMEKQFTNEMHK